MLGQILTKTPIWVWILLAYLISRGVAASKARELPLRKAVLLPALMPVLSLLGILSAFGHGLLGPLCWLACGAIAATLRYRGQKAVGFDRERATVLLPGSWAPLFLMLGIFVTKFAVAVLIAAVPGLRESSAFVAAACSIYGVFSGMFFANLLHIGAAYRSAQGADVIVA